MRLGLRGRKLKNWKFNDYGTYLGGVGQISPQMGTLILNPGKKNRMRVIARKKGKKIPEGGSISHVV